MSLKAEIFVPDGPGKNRPRGQTAGKQRRASDDSIYSDGRPSRPHSEIKTALVVLAAAGAVVLIFAVLL